MKFGLWKKGYSFQIYVKAAGQVKDAVIRIKDSKIIVDHPDDMHVQRIKAELVAGGVDIRANFKTTSLISAFSLSSLDISFSGDLRDKQPPKPQPGRKAVYEKIDIRSSEELYQQSLMLDISSAPFIRSTKNLEITVDTREPKKIYELFTLGKVMDVKYAALEIGDILVRDTVTNDTLIFERKVITDMYNSTVSGHLHSQAERLYEYEQALKSSGARCKVIWLVEGEQEGARMLYNGFPEIKQTDGLMNYLTGILGQHVLCTFSKQHTVYLALKLIQGNFELELKYKVNTAKSKKERVASTTFQSNQKDEAQSVTHGVTLPQRGKQDLFSVIPGINRNVAAHLAENGITVRDLCGMSLEDLCKIDGIGEKSAQKIMAALT